MIQKPPANVLTLQTKLYKLCHLLSATGCQERHSLHICNQYMLSPCTLPCKMFLWKEKNEDNRAGRFKIITWMILQKPDAFEIEVKLWHRAKKWVRPASMSFSAGPHRELERCSRVNDRLSNDVQFSATSDTSHYHRYVLHTFTEILLSNAVTDARVNDYH